MNKAIFILEDNFDWDGYEKKVYKNIINISDPVEVIWDLRKLTKIPSFYIIKKQIELLRNEKTLIIKNIIKNTLLVSSEFNRDFVKWVFKYIYSPKNPTEIIIKLNEL